MQPYRYNPNIMSRIREARTEPRRDLWPSDVKLREWIFDKFGYPYRDLVRIIGYIDPSGHVHCSEPYFDVASCTITARQVRVERIVRTEAKQRGWHGAQLLEFVSRALTVEMHVDDPRWDTVLLKNGRPEEYRHRRG